VWRSRQFTPGIIHLGNPAEKLVLLCRYQDASWKFERPCGWLVNIERSGRYEISMRPEDVSGPGRIVVSWQGKEIGQSVKAGERLAEFSLGAGQGTIDVNFVSNEAATPEVAAKSIGGDVSVRYLAVSAPAPAE